MVKNGKLSRKGKIVTCGKCGENGHYQRACTGPRNKQPTGKGKRASRSEGVPDMKPSEVDKGTKGGKMEENLEKQQWSDGFYVCAKTICFCCITYDDI